MRPASDDSRPAISNGMAAGNPLAGGFSLVEVIVAIGVFSISIAVVLGLLTPIVRSVSSNKEAQMAAHVVDLLLGRVRGESWETVAGYLKTSAALQSDDARPDYNPAADSRVFFASLSGDKIGRATDPVWENSDREFFFEIALVRNDELSPSARDEAAAWLAFDICVRWPAYIATAGAEVQPSAFSTATASSASRKYVRVFAGSVRR